ncbi:MAG: FtsX-like permease family protein [Candidatus Hodarchaeota archaeon]
MKKISIWFIWKKAYKTLLKNKRKTFPVIILLTFSIGFGTILFDIQDIRSRAVEEAIEKTNFADSFVYFEPLPEILITQLIEDELSPYLDDYEVNMLVVSKFVISGKDYDGVLVGINISKENHVNKLINGEKEEIEDYEFALNWAFADDNNIKSGTEILFSYGSYEMLIEIENIGYNPEFQFLPLYKNTAFPSIRPYPVLYLDKLFLNNMVLNYSTPLVNYFVYKLKDQSNIQLVKEKVELIFGEYLTQQLLQEQHPFVKTMREDEKNDRRLILFLTIILLIGAIITLILVINKLVEDDLKSISVFQALGSNRKEILASFLIFNMLLISFSFLFGVLFSIGFNIPVNNFMMDALNIPFDLGIIISFNNSLWIGLILFIVSIISTLSIVKRTFKMDVQKSMKFETKFLEKINIIEKLYRKIKKNPHPLTKYNLRRIFGKKLHLISLILALSFSASLIIFTFSFPNSINYSVNRQFNEIEKWDCYANTWQYEDDLLINSSLNSIEELTLYEFGISDSILFSKYNDTEFKTTHRLMAYEENSELHRIKVERGEIFEDIDDVILSKDIIEKYHLEIGDIIYVKSIGLDKIYQLRIVGLVNDLTASTLYLMIPKAQIILNRTHRINTIYFTSNNIDTCAEKVQNIPEVEIVVKMSSLKEDIKYVLQMISSFFIVFGVVFLLFGVLLLLIIFKSNIDYRIEDYCSMKAIGLSNLEIGKSLSYELLFYFIVSLLLGSFLGNIISKFIITMYSTIMPGIHYHLYSISYFFYISIFGIIILLSFFINLRRVQKVQLAKMMREKTFG